MNQVFILQSSLLETRTFYNIEIEKGIARDTRLDPVGSAPGLENFADRTRSKKILVQIIIFFEFFLIIDNVKAIKQKTNDIKCVNLFI